MEFDKIRLATSVTNRILNTFDAIQQRRPLPVPPAVDGAGPITPDATMQGAALDVRLEQPVAGDATPVGEAAGQAALLGGTSLEGMLTNGEV